MGVQFLRAAVAETQGLGLDSDQLADRRLGLSLGSVSSLSASVLSVSVWKTSCTSLEISVKESNVDGRNFNESSSTAVSVHAQ